MWKGFSKLKKAIVRGKKREDGYSHRRRRRDSFAMSRFRFEWCMPKPKVPPPGRPPIDPMKTMTVDEYEEYLEFAEYYFDRRFKANSCPRAKLDDFRVTGRLGSGGFGAVFLVEHHQGCRGLALKLQIKETIKENDRLEEVIREKKLHYAMQHKFIVRLLFAFQDSKNLYMVMERAAYGDLSRLRGLDEELIRKITVQVILAFEYIHQCSVLHRDLKPENVLLFEDYYVKLTDFGIAKKIRGRTSSMVGCLPYLPPEVHRSDPYGRDFDFWLLGHFIYELTYGKRAFYERNWSEHECKRAVLTKLVSFPSGVDEDSAVNRLIKALLAKHRCNRLGTLRGGIDDVKRHDWFKEIHFHKTFNKEERMDLDVEPLHVGEADGFEDMIGEPLKKYGKFRDF